jgi:hypothetical protein
MRNFIVSGGKPSPIAFFSFFNNILKKIIKNTQ